MSLIPVYCELKDDHIVVYQSDGKTRTDHGIYNIITERTCSKCGDPRMLKVKGEFHCLESYLHSSLKDTDGIFQLGYYHKKYSSAKQMMNKDVLSKDIIKLKNNYNYAVPIAKAMFLLMKSNFPILLDADALVPVPNHPDDPFRHTKAIAVTTELANEYSQHGKPIPVISALNKILNKSTHGLSRSEREEIVENMFEFNKNKSVENKNIVLVDDVLTAGNIKGRCTTILKEHGAKRVWCFVIGRTI